MSVARSKKTNLTNPKLISHLQCQNPKKRQISLSRIRTTDHEGSEDREQREREQREREQREQERREREHRKIEINFARWEDNTWKDMPALLVDSENTAIVKETIEAYMTQGIRALNTELIMMAPDAYYQAVLNDRTHTILLVSQDKISIGLYSSIGQQTSCISLTRKSQKVYMEFEV
jgi:hypothetical protein